MTYERCHVTHAPGRSYVCWTHKRFLPWSEPWRPGRCCCDRSAPPIERPER